MTRRGVVFIVVALVLLFVTFPLFLYSMRAETPAVPTVPVTQAVADVQSGRVVDVTIEEDRAVLTRTDGTREETHVPSRGPNDPLEDAVTAWNQANPARRVGLRVEAGPPAAVTMVMNVLVGLLPIIVLGALIIAAASLFARGARADPFERLARLADLRDRGALTEDEFQREKRKILR